MPGSSEMPGTSGIDTAYDNSAIVASITVARRVDTDHDNRPRSSGTRPASIPGTMSPPAGSQSTTRTGEGHTMASAHVEVVVPGAALPDVITVNIAGSPARRQQHECQVAGRSQLCKRHTVGRRNTHINHGYLRCCVPATDLGNRGFDSRGCRRYAAGRR